MEPTPELAAQLDKDRREAAEMMTPGERLLVGAELFDLALMMMRAGIRMQHPDTDAAEVERIVLERLQIADRNRQRR
jgi:Rv0078B-related antitoxin